jgi:hypothetical protein
LPPEEKMGCMRLLWRIKTIIIKIPLFLTKEGDGQLTAVFFFCMEPPKKQLAYPYIKSQ